MQPVVIQRHQWKDMLIIPKKNTIMLGYIVLAVFATVSANVVHNDKCPELKAIENFDVTAYMGTWYEISKFPTEAEKNGKCASAEYKLDGETVKVKNTHVVNGVQAFIEGTAKLAPDANSTGKLLVSLKFADVVQERPLTVLATDYTNYAIVYTCKYDEKNNNHQDFAWILSRTKKLEGDAKTAVDKYLADNAKELDTTKLVATDFSEEACKFTSSSLVTEPAKN